MLNSLEANRVIFQLWFLRSEVAEGHAQIEDTKRTNAKYAQDHGLTNGLHNEFSP